MNDIIFARAPVRVCDIGGWTDTWFCERGAVFNFCVDLYSYVRVKQQENGPGNSHIDIISENLDLSVEIQEYRKIEYDGTLDLLKAAIKRMNIHQGIKVFARSDAPPGCGTGTSASIAVAMIGALSMLQGHYYVPHETASLAHALETEELKLESGVQDQHAAVHGGFNYIDIEYPNVHVSRIEVKPELQWQLEQQMVLVYLASRSSSDMHQAVIKHYRGGHEPTLHAFETLRACPRSIVQACYKGDLDQFGEIMTENWEAQKQLHPAITNAKIERLETIARDHDALGFKVNGAGGGGSAVILASTGNEHAMKQAITRAGYQILPFTLNQGGLQVWRQNGMNHA